ncbi:nuclear transport factor 2 family protein [Amycolatopsis sp. NPDC059090]|uniref:nuclear transport factor 2 family protein n=1 Tax=unclassified Amycolatopsis TaxID=2618356 RepID=UPI00366A5D88
MTARAETATTAGTFDQIYAEVQQFYAHSMQLLDDGAAEEWAATFAEDATFSVPTLPEPVRGRSGLVIAVKRTRAELAEANEVHRHWHGMVSVRPQPDGSFKVRCYAQVIATKLGGGSRLHRVCVCEDVLIRGESGELLVRSREVSRDDLN